MFIAIDGIDGLGKTTLVGALVKKLASQGIAASAHEEFPRRFLGGSLATLVRRRHEVIFGKPGTHVASETAVLFGNDLYRWETARCDAAEVQVFDRLFAHLVAYQGVRASEPGIEDPLAVSNLLEHVVCRWLPKLDLLLVLTGDEDMVRSRLVARSGATAKYIKFLMQVQDVYLSRFKNGFFLDARKPIESNVERMTELIRKSRARRGRSS